MRRFNKVCFDCRVTMKATDICPHCREPMIFMGRRRMPKRNNISKWKAEKARYYRLKNKTTTFGGIIQSFSHRPTRYKVDKNIALLRLREMYE